VRLKKKITTTFDEELIHQLKIEAAKLKLNVNDILEVLIKKFLSGETTLNGGK